MPMPTRACLRRRRPHKNMLKELVAELCKFLVYRILKPEIESVSVTLRAADFSGYSNQIAKEQTRIATVFYRSLQGIFNPAKAVAFPMHPPCESQS